MDQTVSPVQKFREMISDYLKKEDFNEVKARSKKQTVNLYRRKKSESPWLHCFFFNDNKPDVASGKSPLSSVSKKDLSDNDIMDIISNYPNVTDEEINYCKAALRREARSNKLPDLQSEPDKLQKLFSKNREEFNKDIMKQKMLFEEMNHNMIKFKISLNKGLDVLKLLSDITITSDNSLHDAVVTNITKMRCMAVEFQTCANLAQENLCKAVENFENYQEIDEKIDRELFNFLAHFFSNFLTPRNIRKK